MHKASRLALIAFALTCAACDGGQTQAPQAPSAANAQLSEADLDRMVEWLTGEWDNIAQVEAEIAGNLPENARHHRYAMRYHLVDAPALGGRVIAIENYNDGDGLAGEMARISLHRFTLSDDRKHIVHEIMLFADPAFRTALKQDLVLLSDIGPDDVSANQGCRMFWTFDSERFEGRTRKGACVTNSYTLEDITVEAHGVLEPGRLSRHDRNYRMTGEEILRDGHATPEVFTRPR